MRLAPPPLAPLHSGDDPLGIELKLPLSLVPRPGVLVGLVTAGIALELLAGAAEELPAPFRGAQLLRQLIAASLAELLVLGLICCLDLLNDLHRDLPELLVAFPAGVGRDPSAIDRHRSGAHKPGLSAQPQHLAKQAASACP